MPLTIEERITLTEDARILRRVKLALVYQARAVIAEPSNTTNHANRVIFATAVLRDPERWVPAMTLALMGNLTRFKEAGDFSDANIALDVLALWDGFSGV